jgi:hypothetical protein
MQLLLSRYASGRLALRLFLLTMTYCVSCELYEKCQRRGEYDRVPFHGDFYRYSEQELYDLSYFGT